MEDTSPYWMLRLAWTTITPMLKGFGALKQLEFLTRTSASSLAYQSEHSTMAIPINH
jgi:hypothetical protein